VILALPVMLFACIVIFALPAHRNDYLAMEVAIGGILSGVVALVVANNLTTYAVITDSEIRSHMGFVERGFALRDIQSAILLPTAQKPNRLLIWDTERKIGFSYETMSRAQLIQIYDVVRERAAKLGNHIHPGFPPMPPALKPNTAGAMAVVYVLAIFAFIGLVAWTKLSP
jgi:hypothetical protein